MTKRPLIINFKNYTEASADRTVELARAAQEVAEKLGAKIIVVPPQPSLAAVSKAVEIPVFSQHIDDADPGSTTGYFVAEIAKSYGATGSLINHSEHRVDLQAINKIIQRMKKLKMTSVACARTPDEVRQISKFEPDFIAIEPPELIGSGKAVSKENPNIITDSIKAVVGSKSLVICGAGITDKSDVSAAIHLGSQGILVASSVIKAKSWSEKIEELAIGLG